MEPEEFSEEFEDETSAEETEEPAMEASFSEHEEAARTVEEQIAEIRAELEEVVSGGFEEPAEEVADVVEQGLTQLQAELETSTEAEGHIELDSLYTALENTVDEVVALRPEPIDIALLLAQGEKLLFQRASRDLVLAGLPNPLRTYRRWRHGVQKRLGSHLSWLLNRMGAAGTCERIEYCKNKDKWQRLLDDFEAGSGVGKFLAEYSDLMEDIVEVVGVVMDTTLPLSYLVMITVYGLDDLCDCDEDSSNE